MSNYYAVSAGLIRVATGQLQPGVRPPDQVCRIETPLECQIIGRTGADRESDSASFHYSLVLRLSRNYRLPPNRSKTKDGKEGYHIGEDSPSKEPLRAGVAPRGRNSR